MSVKPGRIAEAVMLPPQEGAGAEAREPPARCPSRDVSQDVSQGPPPVVAAS